MTKGVNFWKQWLKFPLWISSHPIKGPRLTSSVNWTFFSLLWTNQLLSFRHLFSVFFQAQEKVGQCERTLTSLRTNLVLLIRWLIFRKSFSNSWYVKRKSNIWPERFIHFDTLKLQSNYKSSVSYVSTFFLLCVQYTLAVQSRIPIIQSCSSLSDNRAG